MLKPDNMKEYTIDKDNKFRFNAKKVFLTYSQTPVLLNARALETRINKKAEIREYLIAQESHEDGGKHLHAYFEFEKELDVKSANFFDLKFYGKNYHPRIEKPKTRYQLFAYIKKEGKYETNIAETRPHWERLLDINDEEEMLTAFLEFNPKITGYSGYKTFRDLWELKWKYQGERFENNFDEKEIKTLKFLLKDLSEIETKKMNFDEFKRSKLK